MNDNILIVGGYGNIASALAKELHKKKKKIFIFDKLDISDNENYLNYKFVGGDINNIGEIIKNNNISLVYNLMEDLSLSNKFSHELYNTNVTNSMLLLNTCVKLQIKCLHCNWYDSLLKLQSYQTNRKEFFIIKTLNEKKNLIEYYKKYVNIINVNVPRIIDFNESIYNIFAILPKVYSCIKNEIGMIYPNINIDCYDKNEWCDIDTIIYTLTHDNVINKNQETNLIDINIPNEITSASFIISVLLDMLDVDQEIIVNFSYSDINLRRMKYDGTSTYINVERYLRSAIRNIDKSI